MLGMMTCNFYAVLAVVLASVLKRSASALPFKSCPELRGPVIEMIYFLVANLSLG